MEPSVNVRLLLLSPLKPDLFRHMLTACTVDKKFRLGNFCLFLASFTSVLPQAFAPVLTGSAAFSASSILASFATFPTAFPSLLFWLSLQLCSFSRISSLVSYFPCPSFSYFFEVLVFFGIRSLQSCVKATTLVRRLDLERRRDLVCYNFLHLTDPA